MNFQDFVCSCDSDLLCHKLLLEFEKGKDLTAAVGLVAKCRWSILCVGITGTGDFFAFKDPHGIKPYALAQPRRRIFCFFGRETVSLDINNFTRDFELEQANS